MKSIKEKAKEYSSGYMNLDRQQVAKQALEWGANYVLEEIETIIKADLGSYKSQLDRIKNVIEQLKK